MANKAHTATVHRLCLRFGGTAGPNQEVDIVADGMLIEVETTVTLADGIERLSRKQGARYIAVTNMESIQEALRVTADLPIGVMDPHGNIVKTADPMSVSTRD